MLEAEMEEAFLRPLLAASSREKVSTLWTEGGDGDSLVAALYVSLDLAWREGIPVRIVMHSQVYVDLLREIGPLPFATGTADRPQHEAKFAGYPVVVSREMEAVGWYVVSRAGVSAPYPAA